jgi:site-specific recombinase XerD
LSLGSSTVAESSPSTSLESCQPRRETVKARLIAVARHEAVSPHVLRHTAAMNLLRAGVDTSVIALWLGPLSPRRRAAPLPRAL